MKFTLNKQQKHSLWNGKIRRYEIPHLYHALHVTAIEWNLEFKVEVQE